MRILGGALAVLLAGSAVAAPVPLKDFARHDEFQAAEISPNGDYLAVTMLAEGRAVLGIIDLKTRKVSGQLKFPEGNEVAFFDWVSPTRVVVSVAKSYGPLDQPFLTGELYAINADGSGRKYLFGFRGADTASWAQSNVKAEFSSAFMFNPLVDDPLGALVRVYSWRGGDARGYRDTAIERIDVNNGKRKRITGLPGYEPAQVVADRSGGLRFSVVADVNTEPHLYTRDESVAGGWKEVSHPRGAPQEVDLHMATADGSAVFLTSDEDGGRACLREYRVDSGALRDRLCRDTGAVGRPIFSFDMNTLLGVRHEDGKPDDEWFEPKHPDALVLRSLIKAFGGQRVRVTSRTLDGKKLLVSVDSDRNPGDFYLVERETMKATYLLSRRAWIDPEAQSPVEAITYKTRDGATIHGFLTARDALATRKAPLVIMPHGGPHGPRDYWAWDNWAQALASRGYPVLQVNYRGSGGYGYAHQAAGYRKWSTLMQDDLTDAVKWAVAQGIADADRVCIMGASYGGYAALMSPVREPDLYRCAIAFAGVFDVVAQAETSDIGQSRFGRLYLEEVLGDNEQMRAHSPVTYLDKLKVPILIGHGTDDERVPFSQAKILRKAMDKLGKPYEWAEYEGERHGFYIEANHEDFLKRSIDFLDKHIGPNAAPKAAPAQTQ
jgi:dipeptidyl aminopeptidase/acylaminoacyl peptidase